MLAFIYISVYRHHQKPWRYQLHATSASWGRLSAPSEGSKGGRAHSRSLLSSCLAELHRRDLCLSSWLGLAERFRFRRLRPSTRSGLWQRVLWGQAQLWLRLCLLWLRLVFPVQVPPRVSGLPGGRSLLRGLRTELSRGFRMRRRDDLSRWSLRLRTSSPTNLRQFLGSRA
jgi:hypothetical protein